MWGGRPCFFCRAGTCTVAFLKPFFHSLLGVCHKWGIGVFYFRHGEEVDGALLIGLPIRKRVEKHNFCGLSSSTMVSTILIVTGGILSCSVCALLSISISPFNINK